MNVRAAISTVLAAVLFAGFTPPTFAQDSFGGAPAQSPPSAPASMDAAPPTTGTPATPGGYGALPARTNARSPTAAPANAEMQDFGVTAQDALRPSESLHAPTPTSVPGARTLDTKTLASLMRDPQYPPLLFHVLNSAEHLPGAVAAAPAGQGGGFDDAAQQEFRQFLQRMSRGDTTTPMVFYCGGTHCWMSYNAALRAVHLGYRNVAWYRGGIEAWRNAGLPIENASSAASPGGSAPASAIDASARRPASQ